MFVYGNTQQCLGFTPHFVPKSHSWHGAGTKPEKGKCKASAFPAILSLYFLPEPQALLFRLAISIRIVEIYYLNIRWYYCREKWCGTDCESFSILYSPKMFFILWLFCLGNILRFTFMKDQIGRAILITTEGIMCFQGSNLDHVFPGTEPGASTWKTCLPALWAVSKALNIKFLLEGRNLPSSAQAAHELLPTILDEPGGCFYTLA